MTITQQEVRETFDYNPDTGELTWLKQIANCVSVGSPVRNSGSGSDRGRMQVQMKGRRYYSHNIIWLWVHGYLPENEIDHINRNGMDNRLENLREVSRSCNVRNVGVLRNNTSGVTGVTRDESRNRWVAVIQREKRQVRLGRFKLFTDAVRCRHEAEVKMGWPKCNSGTAAYLYLNQKENSNDPRRI